MIYLIFISTTHHSFQVGLIKTMFFLTQHFLGNVVNILFYAFVGSCTDNCIFKSFNR